jgi:TRAP-type mannitol/chloroaromatic compound transport system permease small subunit
MTHFAVRLIQSIDRYIDLIGRGVSWLTLIMVVTVVVVVVARYFLQIGSIALQESVTYLHSAIFLIGIAYTLQHDGHVRVDIFYRQFSIRQRALVNFFGNILFLMPVSGLILVASWEYVLISWTIRETSTENNGLPFVYVLKSLMLLMPAILVLQGVSELLKSFLVLLGRAAPIENMYVYKNRDSQEQAR